MKKMLSILFALLFCGGLYAQIPRYSRILIPADEVNLKKIAEAGVPLEPGTNIDGSVILEISQREINKIKDLNLDYELIIDDLGKFYEDRNRQVSYELNPEENYTYPVPEGWELGSMGGMYTYDQVMAELDTMRQLYPDLISDLFQIENFYSHEGRPMQWIKISDHPELNEDEPEILYTAVHHAREGIGIQQLIFYMYYLLENYDSDSLIHGLVNSTQMYFVPFVNPDGYIYNESWYPNGGGMWRKNRRDNGDGSFGVDLNRNYGYMWGYDNFGSSPYPEDDNYRGAEAFSEPEIQAIKSLCDSRNFKIALNYHSFGNYLLYPWGYVSATCEDDDIFSMYAQIMTRENNSTYGPGGVALYRTNGGSDDWMYGEQNEKPAIFSYTPEVGTSGDGFWPPVSRILPLCRQNMYQNIMAARLGGYYAVVRDNSPFAIGELQGNFSFKVTRLGLSDNGTYTVSVEPLNDAIVASGDPVIFSGLDLLEEQQAEISYSLRSDIMTGDEISYLLKVSNGYITDTDTVRKMYGQQIVLFEDDCNSFDNWNGSWYTSPEEYFSAPYSITDSPYGDYANNMIYITTTKQEIDLTSGLYAELSFRARWDIVPDDDWVQILISTDDGVNWDPLQGQYTRVSNENIIPGQPFYDGLKPYWVKEIIPLVEYLNKSVKFRFVLRSNGSDRADGFYFDDFTVSVLPDITGTGENVTSMEAIQVFPNPASDRVIFRTSQKGFLRIYDAEGKLILNRQTNVANDYIEVDLSSRQSGIYLYTFTGNESSSSGKLAVN